MAKLLKGQWDSNEIEMAVARKLEQQVRSGNFQQISNIPFEVSRLSAELCEIQKQLDLVKDEQLRKNLLKKAQNT